MSDSLKVDSKKEIDYEVRVYTFTYEKEVSDKIFKIDIGPFQNVTKKQPYFCMLYKFPFIFL